MNVWRKVGNHSGVLTRVSIPSRGRKTVLRAPRPSATLAPLPDLEWDALRRLAKRTPYAGAVAKFDHVVSQVDYTATINGERVAARLYRVYVAIDLRKDLGFDENTIESMYDGQDTLEEIMDLRVFRHPENPRRLCAYC